ncbi:AAA family ATPase [Candidatus Woesearchaeota archaeon]|nr:AAA family ATPase [Candidatus Woesearchaeota archaeon]
MPDEIKLKVAEAIQDDVNKGIVRIDSSFMQQAGIRPGDIVEIKGERATVSIADRAYPGDIGLNIIRMDGIIRRNAKTGIGEIIKVKKAEVKEAKKVIIAPAKKGVSIRASSDIFKHGLLGRAVVKGDIVALGGTKRRRSSVADNPFFDDVFNILDESMLGFGFGDLKFLVADTSPKGAVIISDETEVVFNPEAVEVEEYEGAPEITYEDIGGLSEEIKKIREMVELPLKHPEVFERLGVEPPKGVLLHGPPGTGKTLLAKAVANETNSHFIVINGPEIMSKYYGQSLPGDEKILIREDGMIKRVAIGEIVENNRKNIECVCFDKEGKAGIKKVSALIKHRRKSDIMEVKTATGRTIRVTDDHSLFTLGEKGVEDIKTSELMEGESFIAAPKRLPFNPEPIYEIDLLQLLKENDYGITIRNAWKNVAEAIDKIGMERCAEILGVRKKYLYDIKCKNVGIRASEFLRLMNEAGISLKDNFMQISTKGKSMPSTLRLSEELMLFFGLWMAEGSYTNKNEVRLSIHINEENFVAELCKKLFGMVTIYRKKHFKSSDIYICSGILGKVMRDVLGFKHGSRVKEVPYFAYNVDRNMLGAFLRGYISGDGHLNLKTPAPMVEIATKSYSLADDIAYLFLQFGIVTKIYSRKDRPQKRLCFADYENLAKFMEIGFISPEKNMAIGKYLLSKKFSRRDQIPVNDKILSNYAFHAWKGSKTIGVNVLQRAYPHMAGFIANDIKWERVVSIKKSDCEDEYVYDVSVPNAENFIAGFGGIYAHNSEENLRKKFEEAEKNAPSIMFIDEIDAIASKREETRGEVERRVVAQLLALMDGLKSRGKVVVIAATNVPNILDPALRRPGRFDREIEIGVPGKEGRLNILKIHTRNMPLYNKEEAIRSSTRIQDNYREALFSLMPLFDGNKSKVTKKGIESKIQRYLKDHPDKNALFKDIDSENMQKYLQEALSNPNVVDLEEISGITYGFVGADLASLAKESAMIVLRRVLPELKLQEEEAIPKEMLDQLRITQKDFYDALKVVRPSALREVLIEIPNIKWKDIGGLEEVKQELKEAVEWPLLHPESFRRMGVKPPKGILLYGVPGAGKTMLAKAVASETQSNFILVKGPELLSKWLGESEKAVREVFKKARQTSPTIIFFDEIDSLAPKRGLDGDNHGSDRVVNQLLTEIDGLEEMHDVVIIAATNRPDIMDPALLRPGRFDRIVLVTPPDDKSREEILRVHTKDMPITLLDDELKKLEEEYSNKTINLASKMAADEAVSDDDVNHAKTQKEKSVKFKNLSEKDKMIYVLADKMEGYVGADIENVCREAAILALRNDIKSKEITFRNFEEAMKKVPPSVSEDIEKAYANLKYSFSSARAKQMKEEKPAYMG